MRSRKRTPFRPASAEKKELNRHELKQHLKTMFKTNWFHVIK